MANYNKIIMMGRLTRDPELSFLPSQTPVVEFALASSRKFRGSDGQMREDTCFIDCRMYGKRAEVISKYCHKGDPLMIEGRLQFDRWEAQDGSKRSKHRIFVENFEFIGGNTSSRTSDAGSQPADHGETPPPQEENSSPTPDSTPQDDIPF